MFDFRKRIHQCDHAGCQPVIQNKLSKWWAWGPCNLQTCLSHYEFDTNLRCRYSWVLQASHITTYIRWCYIISQQRWIPTTVPMGNRLKKQLRRLNPFTSLLLLKGFVSINSKSISQWYMSVITTTKKGYISHRIVKRRAWWSPFKICPGKNNSITKHLSMISNNSTHLEFDLFKITLPLGIVWEV